MVRQFPKGIMKKIYAGIGSRETPPDFLKMMTLLGEILSKNGFLLRSGGAEGADKAFALKSTKNEIFYAKDSNLDCEMMAESVIPHWSNCKEFARKLHGRNCKIILGADLNNPVDFVICWTKNGKSIGGTRTGIVLAEKWNIPVFNLALESDLIKLNKFLKEKYNIDLFNY